MPTPTATAQAKTLLNAQNHRLLRLKFPNDDGPSAELLPYTFSGTERVSRDFEFNSLLICEDARLELKNLLGKMVTHSLVREDGSLRHFNGYIFQFALDHVDAGLAYYRMQIRPWLAFLNLRQNNHLFHGKNLHDQSAQILGQYPQSDWEYRVSADDAVMTDACQFAETDYNYLHRRWEARGWSYTYEHREDGHTLLLLDDSTTQTRPIDGKPIMIWQDEAGSMDDDGIHRFTPRRTLAPTRYSASSFDFKNPHALIAEIPTVNQQGQVPELEIYDYAGAYGFKDSAGGDALVKQHIEALEARAKHFEAQGNERCAAPYQHFRLQGHFDYGGLGVPEDDAEFLILDVYHSIQNNYQLGGAGAGAEAISEYRNVFTCIRKKIPWRPGRGYNSTEPRIYGLQTAIVVGPKGEEIHTDEYGRVRVQFHWDREGAYDEKSSAWVRVASTWAGSNFGFMAVPRIGQEVVVQWLDGNPDRPLITARVYNQDNMPPWELPANQTQTGILSRSSHGGGYDNANALRFEDKKGAEELWLHAERDQRIEVEHDESHWVGHDRSKTIDNDETVHVKHDRTETVDNNETITVHNNRTERVDHNETISIGDNRTEDVGQNETISIGQNRTETVGANESISIGGNQTETIAMAKAETIGLAKALTIGLGYQTSVGGAMNTSVGLMQSEQVGQSKSTTVGASYSIDVTDELTITVGKSSLVMKADGTVLINGTRFDFTASGPVAINGKDVDIN